MTMRDIDGTNGAGKVFVATSLDEQMLDELCDTTLMAMLDGQGFNNWDKPPTDKALKAFWKGIALNPYRDLILATLDDRVVGAVQLIRPGPINEMGTHAGTIAAFFVHPDARSSGFAKALLTFAEELAREAGLLVLELSLRAHRTAAIQLIEALGYHMWAEKPDYAYIGGRFLEGFYYSKVIGTPQEPGQGAIA